MTCGPLLRCACAATVPEMPAVSFPSARKKVLRALFIFGMAGLSAISAEAAGVGNAFEVKVSFQTLNGGGPPPPPPPVGGAGSGNNGYGFCRNSSTPGAFGATVTVVCATGSIVDIEPGRSIPWSPMHGGSFRYVTQAYWNGEWIDTIDNPPGTGTITSWRVVRLANRSFLELTVGW